MRAAESARADAILDDPYAAAFLRWMRPVPFGALRGLRPLTNVIVARHRVMDDVFLANAADMEQILVLGAGYDMRAYRHAAVLRGRPVFEVDHPATAARKSMLAAAFDVPAAVDVRRVTVDFLHESMPEKLVAAGFIVGRPTFVFWEGVTMYLTADAVGATLTDLARLTGPGSRLVADWWHRPEAGLYGRFRRWTGGALAWVGEPLRFGPTPTAATALLQARGFDVVDTWDAHALGDRYFGGKRAVYPDWYVIDARRR